jgi:hypothetical protein
MKTYEIIFADPERGLIRQWKRNKKGVENLVSDWSKAFPLREVMSTKYVEIPTDKVALIDWLNLNSMRPAA